MSLMKQFARNKRSKENTIVVTARLPETLYDKFQTYCEEYGFSLSEAINLLITNEVNSIESEEEKNDDEIKVNTDEYKNDSSSDEMNKLKSRTNRNSGDTKRFKTTQYQINKELPCPICVTWQSASNFSRHADKHTTTTQDIFTNEKYKDKIQAMIESRKAELETKEEEVQ